MFDLRRKYKTLLSVDHDTGATVETDVFVQERSAKNRKSQCQVRLRFTAYDGDYRKFIASRWAYYDRLRSIVRNLTMYIGDGAGYVEFVVHGYTEADS